MNQASDHIKAIEVRLQKQTSQRLIKIAIKENRYWEIGGIANLYKLYPYLADLQVESSIKGSIYRYYKSADKLKYTNLANERKKIISFVIFQGPGYLIIELPHNNRLYMERLSKTFLSNIATLTGHPEEPAILYYTPMTFDSSRDIHGRQYRMMVHEWWEKLDGIIRLDDLKKVQAQRDIIDLKSDYA